MVKNQTHEKIAKEEIKSYYDISKDKEVMQAGPI